VREDVVVVIIIVVVGVDVSVGVVVVVVRARTRIAHLQSERTARWFRGHRWSHENTSDRCSTLSHVSIYDEHPSDWSCLLSLAREDIVVDLIIVVVGLDVSVGVVVLVRANSHSPPSIRAACAKLLKTTW
jgi:hypothetical protein